MVKCRICKEDHWTTQCPYKDTLGPLRDSLVGGADKEEEAGGPAGGQAAVQGAAAGSSGGNKYVPPSRRGVSGAQERISGDAMPDRNRREDTAAIRVSNLSENAQEADLQVPKSSHFTFTLITVVLLKFILHGILVSWIL